MEDWPAFLTSVIEVRRLGHGRYRFRLDDDTETTVVVRRDPRRHLLYWQSCNGPAFAGSVRLAPAATGSTTVTLTVTRPPATFRAAIAELSAPHDLRGQADVQALCRYLESRN